MANVLYRVAGQALKKLVDFGGGVHMPTEMNAEDVGFYERRHFYYEAPFSLDAAQSLTIEYVNSVNVIIKAFQLTLKSGDVDSVVIVGGTPSGTFDTDLDVLSSNMMPEQPENISLTTARTGGSVSLGSGTIVNRLDVATAGATAQAASTRIGGPKRGITPGAYHVQITANANSSEGILYVEWEERP